MLSAAVVATVLVGSSAQAHKLRKQGERVAVAKDAFFVTPTRDWNQLTISAGKNDENWSLDGHQLNDVTFFGGIPAGSALVREASSKNDPLPKFGANTLIVEVPELLEGTYRTAKKSGSFQVLSTEPGTFLGHDGVTFTYQYSDEDSLTRKGEARASIINGKLYMITFDAPRLNYFDKLVSDFRALADSAGLK
jgi:hypothetical protein